MTVEMDEEISKLVEQAKKKMADYWRSNVNKYFSKTSHNYIGLQGVGSISFSYKSGGRLINAVRVDFNRNFNKFRIELDEAVLVNPRSGENYTWTIIEGTNVSRGKFIVSKHARVRDGWRMGTSNAAWNSFRQGLIMYSDAVLLEYQAKANAVLRRHRIKARDYSLPEEIG